jgi:hypothetical protein
VIEREVSLVKGADRVQLLIYSETYQTPPAFGLPASGPITEYQFKVFFISPGPNPEAPVYAKQIKTIGPESSRARIEEVFHQVFKMYEGTGWKAL